jgi:ADP-ribose pyrophosphatase YjhB (NUDIX family)
MPKRYTEEQNRQWLANLPKKNVAVKVVIKSDKGNILLVKPDYKDTWQMPGGGVDANEDPKLTAVREVKEETGMNISVQDLRLIDSAFKADEDYLFLIFEYSKLCDERKNYAVEDGEIEGYKFFPPNEVASLLPKQYHDFWDKYIA